MPVALLVATLIVAACGAPTRDIAAGAPPAASSGAPGGPAAKPSVAPATVPRAAGAAALPTLPPVQSRTPERFDVSGCLRTSPTAVDCTQRAPQLDASAAGRTAQDWRTLSGFVGSQYTTDLSRDTVVVLSDTVTAEAAGPALWSAVGLVRNEHPRTITGVTVEATLLDAQGGVLETVEAASPVATIRAGEPVPFRVQATKATTTVAAVAHVTWRTIEAAGTADDRQRQLEVNTYWTRPYGDDRPVQMYLHKDQAGRVPPYVLFGSVAADAAVARPHVVLAWMSAAGRVLAVRDVDVAEPDGSASAALAAGMARDYLVSVDDPLDGPVVSDTGPMLWGAGR